MALTSRRLLRFALPTVAALGAGAAVGVAAIPSADAPIHACVTTATGAVRIIDAEAGATCTAGTETNLVWNQTGPAGPAGGGRPPRAARPPPAPGGRGGRPAPRAPPAPGAGRRTPRPAPTTASRRRRRPAARTPTCSSSSTGSPATAVTTSTSARST